MLDRMLAERGERPYPSTLRCVLLGGGPAPLPLLERALRRARAGGADLRPDRDGLADRHPGARGRSEKIGSAGKALMGSQIRIEADGEICVRGPSVSPGYLHQAATTRRLAAHRRPWLPGRRRLSVRARPPRRPDHLGRRERLPGRGRGGAAGHPAVEDAGVFAIADAELGQYRCRRGEAAARRCGARGSLLAFCRERLAGYKVPRVIEFRQALPRNAAGKLSRRTLRDERALA